jgi:hypothetical protein
MPGRFYRYCRERGCSERHNDPSGYCAKHQANNTLLLARKERNAEAQKNNPIFDLYNRAPWRRCKEALAGYGNVICQRIENGKRCTRPVEIYHHIFDPKDRPDLMYSPSNIRGVCRQHHPNTSGEPKENLVRLAEIYAPTIWRDIRFK